MRAFEILIFGMVLSASILAARWLSHGAQDAGKDPVEASDAKTAISRTASPSGANASPALQHGASLPDAVLWDQDGREFRLSDLKGKVVVMSFIYTHCNVQSMCPSITAKLVDAHNLVQKRGMTEVEFLLLSFDGERDRPERLKEFASQYGADLTSFRLATGEPAQMASLARALNTYYRVSGPGTFEHNIAVALVDREGKLRDDFFGGGWQVEEVTSAIARLARVSGPQQP